MSAVLNSLPRHLRKRGASIVVTRKFVDEFFPHPPKGECKPGLINTIQRWIGYCRCASPTQLDQLDRFCESKGLKWFNATQSDGVVFYRPV